MRPIIKGAAIATAVVLTAGGVAYAAIPTSSGIIRGCYHKSSGAVRVIDTGKTCKSSEKSLNWSQKGPQGPAGPAGAGSAPETRVGHCVAGIPQDKPAGTIASKVCTYKRPFTNPCLYPEIVVSPATLAGLETEDNNAIRWYPGMDYDYWVTGLQSEDEGGCPGAILGSFTINVRAVHATPADHDVAMGFTYIASVPTK